MSLSLQPHEISPSPRLLDILLDEGTRFKDKHGKNQNAIGCGIAVILGSSRSGKTALSWWILDMVIRHTERPLALIGMPEKVMGALPDSWDGRVSNPSMDDIMDLPPSVILVDDSAIFLNNRSSGRSEQVSFNRLYGILSHLGHSVILTTQSLATIDIGVFRSTHLAVIVRWCEAFGIEHEQHTWTNKVLDAQTLLKEAGTIPYHRDVYYSVQDDLVCLAGYPEWLEKRSGENANILSKPYAYLSKKELRERLDPPKKKPKKKGSK